jgi:hypothetical protein
VTAISSSWLSPRLRLAWGRGVGTTRCHLADHHPAAQSTRWLDRLLRLASGLLLRGLIAASRSWHHHHGLASRSLGRSPGQGQQLPDPHWGPGRGQDGQRRHRRWPRWPGWPGGWPGRRPGGWPGRVHVRSRLRRCPPSWEAYIPCPLEATSKRRTHLVASRSMSERYGIDVIRSWTSEVGLNGPGSTTAADCLRGAIYVCDSFDLSLRSVRGNPKGCRDLWHRCRQPGAAIQRRSFVRWSPPSIACAGFG